jgi:methylase of polypeptide subunit release factors
MIASLRSLLANNSLEAPFSVLDLGTGNGLLLHTLLDADLTPPARMMGIDYSEGSVTLAREVAEARGEGAEEIRWAQCDCVDDEEAVKRLGEWDVLLDKGTVSLVAASVHLKGAWGGGGGR